MEGHTSRSGDNLRICYMNPLYSTIVKPVGGRYNNKKDIGGIDFVLNTKISAKDGEFVNRLGKVKAVPRKSELKVGDHVIVHHNVYRRYWDFTGNLSNSGSMIDEETFQCADDEIYMYKRDGKWKTLKEYCFVKPTEGLFGTMKYFDKEKFNAKEGDLVAFTPFSEHKFVIEGELLYRMTYRDIILSLI